jgi:hypothetical protein
VVAVVVGNKMKVIINSCYGGFSLSEAAIKRCLELGMKLTHYRNGGYEDPNADFVFIDESAHKYYAIHRDVKEFRTNPIVIGVVEELGDAANGPYADLGIIDIPFDSTEGWNIDEYDGAESISEEHRSWS